MPTQPWEVVPAGAAPGGPAGGVLAGTYPDPELAAAYVPSPQDDRAVLFPSSFRLLAPGTRGLSSANAAFLSRILVPRDMTVEQLRVLVTTADAGNPNVDVGIYSPFDVAPGDLELLGSSGSTAGKLNGTGIQSLNLTAPVALDRGQVCYVAVSSPTTAAVLYGIANSGGNITAQSMNGIDIPDTEFGLAAGSFPLPASIASINSGVSSGPAIWLVES